MGNRLQLLCQARDLVKQVIDCCNSTVFGPEIPDEGIEFIESVRERAESISTWINENRRASQKQVDALENMLEGVERWVRD